MSSRTVEHHYTRNILIQMLVVFSLLVAAVIWQRDFLTAVYLKNQITSVGWVINGGIVLLFITGLLRLVQLFVRYASEEEAINRFVSLLQRDLDPTHGLPVDSMIVERYDTLQELKSANAPIHHAALAATLVASESSQVSFPKFVNNVLILTGVFGTIVSLSIALLGASDMVRQSTEIGSLSTVIHGMSTALSTTMTAIVAFLFFGYFYLRLTDTQTYLVSRVEDVTATMLIPRFQIQPEAVMKDFSELIRAAAALNRKLDESQGRYAETAESLEEMIREYRAELRRNSAYFEQMIRLLREGFRLSDRRNPDRDV